MILLLYPCLLYVDPTGRALLYCMLVLPSDTAPVEAL